MLLINANTKIASLLKENAAALDAIISLSPKFSKLKNPLLRKIFAARTSIYMASKVSGCSIDDFFEKLRPLGFMIDKNAVVEDINEKQHSPGFVMNIKKEDITELDVRDTIEKGEDPLRLILASIKNLQPGKIFKLINSFEPIPLIQLLSKQGFEYYVEKINDNLYFTFFHLQHNRQAKDIVTTVANPADNWDEILKKYQGNIEEIDVRALQMPLPMHHILNALEKLPAHKALYVKHKRIPVFLLPELRDRKFDYRIKEVSDGEVYLLIYKE
ncbi:MAG: DUF2249 domain-containing protein [Bacteroidetes bacterium]|nr:DUF2249 domain-containing protein [Bacteroidota bacterium]MBS1757332.1 DUF2249 domain-containing protein [Bacteroidota bacterium]